MSDAAAEGEVPEGAAVFPRIPAELGVQPLLLATLHALVFLQGSSEEVVHPAAADEALDHLASYLERLEGPALRRVHEDFDALASFARQEKWPKQLQNALKTLRDAFGPPGQPEPK